MAQPNGSKEGRRNIAIVGGGIAGVLTALSIANQAPHLLPITLYESAHKFGEIGAGVALGPNAAEAMSMIGEDVLRGMQKCATQNGRADKQETYFDFRCGMADTEGQLIAEVFAGKTSRAMVHRAAFLDEMVALIPEGVQVRFQKRLVGIEEIENGVELKFADGSSATHSAIIACDGIKSRARVLLLGEKDPTAHAVFSGKYCYRGLIPMEQAVEAVGDELARNSQMYLGYHGHMLTFPVQGGKTMNVVAFASADKWEDSNWVVHADREKMYSDFDKWGSNVQKILRLMQKPDIWALFNHKPCKTYHRGRICLSGDAAHASTPHLGSGAGMAVEDGLVMGSLLKNVQSDDQIETAFAAFDAMRRPRTQKLVEASRNCGKAFDFELEGFKDDLEKLADRLHIQHSWVWCLDIATHVQSADAVFEKLQAR